MNKENLPNELLQKHFSALNLPNPLYIRDENDLFQTTGTEAESAVIFLPKSKPLLYMTLALASNMVKKESAIILAGTNDGGIRSAKDAYEKYIGPSEQKITGNHSALYVGKNKKLNIGKTLENFLSFFLIKEKDMEIEIASVPGVFSVGELDEGTKLLLDHITFTKKNVLDIGSGAGIIGAIYKKKNADSVVTMADASKIAVFASQKTLEKNKLAGTVIESDVFSSIKGQFDVILTNPPFHKGIGTDYSFIEKFARDAKSHLTKNGEVYVVANSFLAYKEILEKYIGPTEIITDNGKFRVFKSTL